MIIGTTPTYKITINSIDMSTVRNIYITFAQGEGVEITKTGDEITIEQNVVSTKLSQEETLRFHEGIVLVQVRGTTKSGDAFASPLYSEKVQPILLGRAIE